jgi:hypothetical protein
VRAISNPKPPGLPYLLTCAEDPLFTFSSIRFIEAGVRVLDSHEWRSSPVIFLHQDAVCGRLDWQGKPLINFETVVNLIGGTRTRTGLKIKAVLDTSEYETGVEISKEEIDQIQLKRHKLHPDWNYNLLPHSKS